MEAAAEIHGLSAVSAGSVQLVEYRDSVTISVSQGALREATTTLDADRARYLARCLNRLARRIEARATPAVEAVRRAA